MSTENRKVTQTYETFFKLVVEFLEETPDQIFESVADCLIVHIFGVIRAREAKKMRRKGNA